MSDPAGSDPGDPGGPGGPGDPAGHDPGGAGGPGYGGETCGEKAGFLFSHRCRRPSVTRCARCSRPVCQKHLLESGGGPSCVTCGRKQQRKHRGEHDEHDEYDDNPYFYTAYYYSGYGYYGPGSWGHHYYGDAGIDASDFSEADGASLIGDGDDDDFEHDMGAS